MRFICELSGKRGSAQREHCQEEFPSLEDLLRHIITNHSTPLNQMGRRELKGKRGHAAKSVARLLPSPSSHLRA